MIDWRTMRADEEIFTHWDETSGRVTDLAASRIVTMCRATGEEIWRMPIRQDHAALVMAKRGIEAHRLMRLTREAAQQPVLFLKWPDGTSLLADGSHRYVWLAASGAKEVLCWHLDEAKWRPFVIEGLPRPSSEEALMKSFSGIR